MNGKLFAALVAGVFFSALPAVPVSGQDDPRGTAESIHEEAKDFMGEQHNVLTLPPADPHRIYVVEPIFPVFSRSKTWVVDGDKMKIVERFRLTDPDTMSIETTISDPDALTMPYTTTASLRRHRNWTISEYICEENNRNSVDSSGKAGIDVTLPGTNKK